MYVKRLIDIESIHSARYACGMGCRNCVCETECFEMMNSKDSFYRKAFSRMMKTHPVKGKPEGKVKNDISHCL